MDFHFLVMEKSWKINVEKKGAPCNLYITIEPNDVIGNGGTVGCGVLFGSLCFGK